VRINLVMSRMCCISRNTAQVYDYNPLRMATILTLAPFINFILESFFRQHCRADVAEVTFVLLSLSFDCNEEEFEIYVCTKKSKH